MHKIAAVILCSNVISYTLLPILPAVDDILFNFAQSDDFLANLETAFGRSYDVVKATEFNEKRGFCKKLFRKRVSQRNPFSANAYLETRFLAINVNFCYSGLEKFALVGLKLLAINFCC
ncbi:MAG: hypothetical protein ACKPHW_06470 [Microcystis panniformis]